MTISGEPASRTAEEPMSTTTAGPASAAEEPMSTTTEEPMPTTAADPAAEPRAETASDATTGPLIPDDATMDFRSRWEAVQQGFVDEPRTAVTDADQLVGDVLQRLSQTFEEQHGELERQWGEGEPSTEDLRTALQRYRTFFERLLNL